MTAAEKQLDNVSDIYPMSPLQRGMLYHCLASPDSGIYVEQISSMVEGADFDLSRFKQSWDLILERHGALRCAFVWEDLDEPLQVERAAVELDWNVVNLLHLSSEEAAKRVEETMGHDKARGFVLTRAPLMRMTLFHLPDQKIQWLWTRHHMLADGWSTTLLLNELRETYSALGLNREPDLVPQGNYRDFVSWLKDRATHCDEDREFWRDYLGQRPPRTQLLLSRPNPDESGEKRIREIHTALGREQSTALEAVARNCSVSLNTLVQGCWALLLARYSNSGDVSWGTVFTGRSNALPHISTMIGLCINTVPLRAKVDGSKSIRTWFQGLQSNILKVMEHEHCALADISQWCELDSDTEPFDTLVVFENYPPQRETSGPDELSLGELEFDEQSNLPLAFIAIPGSELKLVAIYDTTRFGFAQVNRMVDQFKRMLEALPDFLEKPIMDLPFYGEGELASLREYANLGQSQRSEWCREAGFIDELIVEQAKASPDRVALVSGEGSCSYGEMELHSRSVAARLVSMGAGPGNPVALCLPKGMEIAVCMVAALRAGSPYVIIEEQLPESRKAQLISSCNPAIAICSVSHGAVFEDKGIPWFDPAGATQEASQVFKRPDRSPSDPAYIMYTSGSTGKPKGVVVSHGNLYHSTRARFLYYPESPDSFLLLSAMSFDSAVAGFYWTLASGGKLVVPPHRVEQDLAGLIDLCVDQGITHTLCLPSVFKLLCEHIVEDPNAASPSSFRSVICAGEVMPVECNSLARKAFGSSLQLYNEYGPTEGTVWCTVFDARKFKGDGPIPIGRPIENTAAFVLDDKLRPSPLGVSGQLAIAGAGVAQGYYGDELSTRKSFHEDVSLFGSAHRIYLTGDWARYDEDGNLEYLGRADDQVKIRGYRIEPGEVERNLEQLEGVHDAVTVVARGSRADQDRDVSSQLVVFVIPHQANTGQAEIAAHLRESLPEYMFPARIELVDEFPLLDNGKVDRTQLGHDAAALLDRRDRETSRKMGAGDAPASDGEILLAAIWKEILGVEVPHVDISFFRLGGDSIQSIRVLSKVVQQGYTLAPQDIFEHPTIRGLARKLVSLDSTTQGEEQAFVDSEKLEGLGLDAEKAYPLTDPQQTYLLAHLRTDVLDPGHMQVVAEFRGKLDPQRLNDSLAKVVDRHEALRSALDWDRQPDPLQVVFREIQGEIDYESSTEAEFKDRLRNIAANHRRSGVDLGQAPTWSMVVLSHSKNNHCLLFDCHHALIDGWSASIVIGELVDEYQQGLGHESPETGEATADHGSYLNWLNSQDFESARDELLVKYRKREFADETVLPLIQEGEDYSRQQTVSCRIEGEQFLNLQRRMAERGLTVADMVHGAWSWALRQGGASDRIEFFVTVSGRNIPLAGVERMVGQYMVHLPYCVDISRDAGLDCALDQAASESAFLQRYQFLSAAMVEQWCRKPVGTVMRIGENLVRVPSLVMVENFPWSAGIKSDHANSISMTSFQNRGSMEGTGGIGAASAFPLAMILVPQQDHIELRLGYNPGYFDASLAQPFVTGIADMLNGWASETPGDIGESLHQVSRDFLTRQLQKNGPEERKATHARYAEPETELEMQLTAIWQGILKNDSIGIDDGFFQAGGTSILAAGLAESIDKQLGLNMPLAALIQNDSVRKLALFLSQADPPPFRSLVEVQEGGSETPVFGIHAEGNVLFYRDLAALLGSERPFYGLQSRELGGSEEPFHRLEDMASYYIGEIRKVQPQGPYILCGMCFGGWIAFEMAQQLVRSGEKVSHLFVFDSGGPIPNEDGGSDGVIKKIDDKIASNWMLMNVLFAIRRQFLNPRKRQLKRIAQNHRFLKRNYTASIYPGKVIFLRSHEWNRIPKFQRHIDRWEKLTELPLETHLVDGEHGNILEPPQVYGCAKIIKEKIDGFDHTSDNHGA